MNLVSIIMAAGYLQMTEERYQTMALHYLMQLIQTLQYEIQRK